MRISNKEIKSRQGVWLVDVIWDDGRKATLPTAHRRFFDSATKRYQHNNADMSKYPGKLKAWKEAIVKHGAVVMTTTTGSEIHRSGSDILMCLPSPGCNWKTMAPTTASRLPGGCKSSR